MVTESRPFFTSHRPGEGIEGILPDKGCGLPSPNQSTSIGISAVPLKSVGTFDTSLDKCRGSTTLEPRSPFVFRLHSSLEPFVGSIT